MPGQYLNGYESELINQIHEFKDEFNGFDEILEDMFDIRDVKSLESCSAIKLQAIVTHFEQIFD